VLRTPIRQLGALAYLVAGGLRLLFEPGLATPARVAWRAAAGAPLQHVDGCFYGVFLAIRPTLGAGMRLPVEVDADDGLFEVVLVETAPRVTVAWNLPRLRRGAELSTGIITVHRAVDAAIEWTGGTPVLGDGEDLGRTHAISARVLPRALAVVVPVTAVAPDHAKPTIAPRPL
jgi:hypothetical protein